MRAWTGGAYCGACCVLVGWGTLWFHSGNILFFLGKDVSSPFEQLESVMCCGSPISRLRPIKDVSQIRPTSPRALFRRRHRQCHCNHTRVTSIISPRAKSPSLAQLLASHAPLVQLYGAGCSCKSMQALAMLLAQLSVSSTLNRERDQVLYHYMKTSMCVYGCVV